MRRPLRQRFATLRWKLTWSYVWVTVVITIMINALVFAVLLGFTPQVSTAALFAMTQQGAKDFAPLVAEQPDRALVATALRYKFGVRTPLPEVSVSSASNTTLLLGEIETLNDIKMLPDAFFTTAPTQPITNMAVVLVLDSEGRVVGGTFPTVFVPGEPLVDPALPHGPLIEAALRNEADVTQLTLRVNDTLAAAAPILADDGQVIGVMYIRSPPLNTTGDGIVLQMVIILVATLVLTVIVNGLIGLIFGWFASRNPVRRLKTLATATASVADGDLSQRVTDDSLDEIGQLGRQFNSMSDQLEASMRSLRQLADRNAALAEQASQLATVEERNRLARDLHDSVSQELFSLTMLAAAARNLLPANPEKAQEQLHQLSQMAQRALHETRALIFALRPAALGDQGLAPALRQMRDEAVGRLGIQISLHITGERRIPLEHEQALFRITQEALANVAKHSGTPAVAIELCYTDQQTCLEVRDRGRGFDMRKPHQSHSLGLISISERAAAVGGTCHVESKPGEGTTVRVCVPT